MTTNTDNGMNCTVICWIVAAIAAILLFLILTGIGMGTFLAVILTLIAFAFGGWWAANNFCSGSGAKAHPAAAPAAAKTAAAPAAVAPAGNPEAAAAAAPAAEPVAEAEPEAVAEVAPEPAPEPAAEEPAAAESAPAAAAPAMKSTLLAGESELASRKGTWRYEGGGAAPAPAAAASEDYDGDGVLEGTDEGEKPSTMAAPREGGGDDLKQIKGVGPKMQDMLNGMGFWHFDQIAAWTDQEVAWVDANLEGFKGRVSRDGWVEQAKVLAAGGETEFSKRVEDGDVY